MLVKFMGGPLDGAENDIKLSLTSPYMVFEMVIDAEPSRYMMYKYESGLLKYVSSNSKEELLKLAKEGRA